MLGVNEIVGEELDSVDVVCFYRVAGSCNVHCDEFLKVSTVEEDTRLASCEEDVFTVDPFAGVKGFGSVDFGQELISLAFMRHFDRLIEITEIHNPFEAVNALVLSNDIEKVGFK